MARLLKPIAVPKNATVKKTDNQLVFKGPVGELQLDIPPRVVVEIADGQITVAGKGEEPQAYVGLTRALIRNYIIGVTEGFTKTLEVRGMGFRAQKVKDGIQFLVGYSHPVIYSPPTGTTIDLKTIPNPDDPKTQITEVIIKGPDKQLIGEIAANIRRYRLPDPYHGKGIRYKGEYVRKKAGKRAVATQQ